MLSSADDLATAAALYAWLYGHVVVSFSQGRRRAAATQALSQACRKQTHYCMTCEEAAGLVGGGLTSRSCSPFEFEQVLHRATRRYRRNGPRKSGFQAPWGQKGAFPPIPPRSEICSSHTQPRSRSRSSPTIAGRVGCDAEPRASRYCVVAEAM